MKIMEKLTINNHVAILNHQRVVVTSRPHDVTISMKIDDIKMAEGLSDFGREG